MNMKRNNPQMMGNNMPGMQMNAPVKKKSGLLGRIIRRFFLVLFTIVILAVVALGLVLDLVFNGPSPAARLSERNITFGFTISPTERK